MRNLFRFLIRFNSLFVFLLLEVICFSFIVKNHNYHNAKFVNSANVVTGSIYNTYYGFSEYLNLRAINDSLMKENAALKATQYVTMHKPVLQVDTSCEDTDLLRLHTYIAARVINNSTNKIANYLTIDKGTNHGVNREMGVISATGIIGIVNEVSDNFSTVMSVLNKNSRISVKLKRFNYPGNLQWNGEDPGVAELTGIPRHLPITANDTVITSGFSSIFPENVLVGTVTSFRTTSGNNFYDIKIRLTTNFETLQYAYVVNYLYKEEQLELESRND